VVVVEFYPDVVHLDYGVEGDGMLVGAREVVGFRGISSVKNAERRRYLVELYI
jgi:hypothetical protein